MLTFATAVAMAHLAEPASTPTPQEAVQPHTHIHAAPVEEEATAPVVVEIAYTAEVIANVAGGLRRGARYLDNLDLVVDADLERVAGWRGAKLHLYGLYNNGASISELAGDSLAVSNIETGVRAARLYEAWIDQTIGAASLRVGLYDLNSEFDALEASSLFVGSAHGIGPDFSQSGLNGPSIFPATSLAARIAVTPAEGWTVRAAVLDGVPGDPARPGRTVVRLGRDDGALLVGEIDAPVAGGRVLLGHWRYSQAFDTLDGGRGRGNSGTYLRAELPLAAGSRGKLDGFGRIGIADGRFNMFDRFASTGFTATGWLPGRGEDAFGLGIAAAFTSERYRRATGAGGSEITFEATYRAQLSPWLAVQPNLHYIRSPSADPTIDDAVVVGIRTELSFDLFGG